MITKAIRKIRMAFVFSSNQKELDNLSERLALLIIEIEEKKLNHLSKH